MADIQEELGRASGIARLSALIRQLDGGTDPDADERRWFGTLLSSLDRNKVKEWRLVTSTERSAAAEQNATLEMLVDLMKQAFERGGEPEVEKEVKLFHRLQMKLLKEQALSPEDRAEMKRLATALRRKFLRATSAIPSNSGLSSVG